MYKSSGSKIARGTTRLNKKQACRYDDRALGRRAHTFAVWGALRSTLFSSRSGLECNSEGPTEGGFTLSQLFGILTRWGRSRSDLLHAQLKVGFESVELLTLHLSAQI